MAFAAATEPISVKLRKDERGALHCRLRRDWCLPEQRHPYIRLRVQPPGRVPFDPSNPCIFSPETLAVVDDAAAGRNLSGPYRTAKEAMVAFDED